jgi:V/A-type H+/Na+-transporting ATPase subunit D
MVDSEDTIEINFTRSELFELKNKMTLAKRGHDLLKKKEDALVFELLKYIKLYKNKKNIVFEKLKESYKSLALDIAYAGIFTSRSASYSSESIFDFIVKYKNIMGVSIPIIILEKKKEDVINQYGNSPQLAEARRNFIVLLEMLIDLSNDEIAIKTIAEEVKKIKRRVNSLEYIKIPKMNNTINLIKFHLEEADRDNFVRLKTIQEKVKE